MTQQPPLNSIFELLSEITPVLDKLNIPYLIHGSLAFFFYTNDENSFVNDVDIIVSQKYFETIVQTFEKQSLPYNVFLFSYNIHANHKSIKGNDGKKFDISFDSYEKYFSKSVLSFSDYSKKIVNNATLKFISKQDLIKIYRAGVVDSSNLKVKNYQHKLDMLQES